jgi:hypothetical protein
MDGSASPPGPSCNGERDFHGEKRGNQTHASTIDPDARPVHKGPGPALRLASMDNILMEKRHGPVVDARLMPATGTAEIDERSNARRVTLAADKAYDTADFVTNLRERMDSPHVAQNTAGRRSAIDRRTTWHPGYAGSQRVRKRIVEVVRWGKASTGLRKTRQRGLNRVGWIFTLTATAYNLIHLPELLADPV